MPNVIAQPRFPSSALPKNPSRGDDRNVYIAAILMYVLLAPPQLNVILLGATFPPYRFFMIAASVYILRSGMRGRLSLVWPDYFVIFAVAWIWLSFYMNVGFENFAVPAGGQTIDIGLSYFLARAAFRTVRDLRIFLVLILPGLAVIGAVLVAESVLHQNLLQPLVGELVGKNRPNWPVDERLGLMRARGSFAHPILAGIFFASFLALYWMSGLRGWPRKLGVAVSFASFFTVSSAALLALTLGGLLASYQWLTERVANLTWRLFFLLSGVLFFAAELGTQSGTFNLIMRFGSLNSSSAFNRVRIWQYGSVSVEKHPWFGIGYADWERPVWMRESIDHYWLLQAIQVGLVPPTMIALATFLAVMALIRASAYGNLTDQRTIKGLAIAMTVFAFGVISVSVWLATQVWFHMLIGMCVSIGYNVLAAAGAKPRAVRSRLAGGAPALAMRPSQMRPSAAAARQRAD